MPLVSRPFLDRLGVFALATSVVLMSAFPARAQDRLFIGTGEIGAFGRFAERIGEAPEAVYGQLVAGGRYVSTLMGAYDTSTGAFVPAQGGFVIGVDPRRPRLFMHDLSVVSVFDLERHVSTPLIGSTGLERILPTPARAQLAPEADELFVWHRASGGGEEIAVVDLTTRTISRRFPIATVLGSFSDWSVTADGRRVFVADGASIRLIDAGTGLAAASRVSSSGRIIDDRLNRRIYVLEAGLLRAFDDALTPLGQLPLGAACGSFSAAFSHHTGRLYLVESTAESRSQKEGSTFNYFSTVLDAASGRRLATGEITQAAGLAVPSRLCLTPPMAVVTAPGAPRELASTVSGRDVTLTWTNVGDATNFVLDAGVASGRTDLTFSIGAISPVTIPNAPPGTYYLRVRGTNAFGVSRPSNEVVVSVQ